MELEQKLLTNMTILNLLDKLTTAMANLLSSIKKRCGSMNVIYHY